jgi:hypothetical protein
MGHPNWRNAFSIAGIQRGMALATLALTTQPERPNPLGSYAAAHHLLAASASYLSSLSAAPHGRHHLRQVLD